MNGSFVIVFIGPILVFGGLICLSRWIFGIPQNERIGHD